MLRKQINVSDFEQPIMLLSSTALNAYNTCIVIVIFQKRIEVLKDINKEIETTAIIEGNKTIKSKRNLCQILDTTLLKCYLQVLNLNIIFFQSRCKIPFCM